MGMTIDDCIDWLCRLRSEVLIFMPFAWHKKMTDALTMAIDTMRKYQKIKQILKDIPYGGDATVRRIQEVIEDDNSNLDNSSMRSNPGNTEHRSYSGTGKEQ